MSRLRVMRILVYEGDEAFIKSSLGGQRAVKGKLVLVGGTITEGFLSGDVGEFSFIEQPKEPKVKEEKTYFCGVCLKQVPESEYREKHRHGISPGA